MKQRMPERVDPKGEFSMRSTIVAIIALALALPIVSAEAKTKPDPRGQVFAAESTFAATMAARDLKAFRSFVAPDAIFFGGRGVLRGNAAVVEGWKRFFESTKAPFSWRPEVVEVLDGFGFHIGKQRISVLTILQGLLSVAITVVIALWAGRTIEARLLNARGMDLNFRIVLSKLVKTLLVIIAILIALPAVGIDITVLSVFGGAVGVGLGLGLQKIAANYVSGFVILLDRSISPGALVTIDGRYGEVTKLTARYVVVKGMDGTEAIIPNETVITSVVVNHSYSDRSVRVDIPIQVSYTSDVDRALELMLEAARGHARVLRNPAPAALLKGFSDSGIDLELYVWVADPEAGTGNLRSDVYRAIWKSFNANDIAIPFPQREVRLLRSRPA